MIPQGCVLQQDPASPPAESRSANHQLVIGHNVLFCLHAASIARNDALLLFRGTTRTAASVGARMGTTGAQVTGLRCGEDRVRGGGPNSPLHAHISPVTGSPIGLRPSNRVLQGGGGDR